jgi:hypothetical protein
VERSDGRSAGTLGRELSKRRCRSAAEDTQDMQKTPIRLLERCEYALCLVLLQCVTLTRINSGTFEPRAWSAESVVNNDQASKRRFGVSGAE